MDVRPINLCKQCIHYVPPPIFKKPHSHAKCSLFAYVSLVDGEIEHELAKDARRDLCKGKFFSPSCTNEQ